MAYHLGPVAPDRRAEFSEETSDEETTPRSHRLIGALLALLVMAIFAGGLWLAYLKGTHSAGNGVANGDVPLIRADQRPTKVKPERPGGMEIPDRDNLIYNPSRPAVEHLLPPPEKPLPRPTAPATQVAALPPTSAAPTAASGQTLPVAPIAPQAPTPPPPPPGAATQLQKSAMAPSGAAAPGASTQPKPLTGQAAVKPGGMRLQLGSVRSEDAARQEWERMKRKNPDLLGSLSATPIRADLGDKGVFYRIMTAPVADLATGERLCSELKHRDIGCIIAR